MTQKPRLLKRYYDLTYRIKNWELYLARNSANVAKVALRNRIRTKVFHAMKNRGIPRTKIKPAELDGLVNLFSYGCVNCDSNEKLELDHVVPISHGGRVKHIMNFQVLCARCHKKKTRAEQYRKTLHELEQVKKQLLKEGHKLR